MSAALLMQIAGYVVAYGPAGFQIISDLINGVRNLQKDGAAITDEQLAALVTKIQAAHDALPPPE